MVLLDPRLKLRLSVVSMFHFNWQPRPFIDLSNPTPSDLPFLLPLLSLSMPRSLSRSAALHDDLYWPSFSPLVGPFQDRVAQFTMSSKNPSTGKRPWSGGGPPLSLALSQSLFLSPSSPSPLPSSHPQHYSASIQSMIQHIKKENNQRFGGTRVVRLI